MRMNFSTPRTTRNTWSKKADENRLCLAASACRQGVPSGRSGRRLLRRQCSGRLQRREKSKRSAPLRAGTEAIRRECRMHSRLSVSQAQCVKHFACPARRPS